MGNLDAKRLGTRPRLCGNAVAHAPAGHRGFCDCHRPAGIGAHTIELSAKALGCPALPGKDKAVMKSPRADTEDVVVRIDPRYFRPAEVETLLGDPVQPTPSWGGLPPSRKWWRR